MTIQENVLRSLEVIEKLRDLVDAGWVVERFQTKDEDREPYRVLVVLSLGEEDPEEGIL